MKKECPSCFSREVEHVHEEKSLNFQGVESSYQFSLSMCLKCSLLFQSSAYEPEYEKVLTGIYKDFKKNDHFDFPYRSKCNLDTLDYILDHLPENKGLNLLEVGSNRGDMLYMIKEKRPDINILGVEPTDFHDLKVPTIKGFFSKGLFSSKFDVIILQHVLEHMKHPVEISRALSDSLADGGILYIEVPDIHISLENQIEDFSLEHVSYFSPFSLENTLSDFERVDLKSEVFLNSIWKKRAEPRPVENCSREQLGELREGLDVFFRKKESIKKLIVEEMSSGEMSNVIFYGNAFYFKFIFNELKGDLDIDHCRYFDDSFKGDQEPFFGLSRASDFSERTLVIVCSNNTDVQSKISSKLMSSGAVIVCPWGKVFNLKKGKYAPDTYDLLVAANEEFSG